MQDKSALYIMRRLSLVIGGGRRHVERSFKRPVGADLYRVDEFAHARHANEILSWRAQAYEASLALSNFSPLKRVVKGHCSCRPLRERIHTTPEKVKGQCTKE